MTETERIIATIKLETDVEVKGGIATSYLTAIERRRVKCKKEDKKALGEFALSEIDGLIEDIRNAKSYKEKLPLIRYEDPLIGFLILCYKYPTNIPEEKQTAVREIALLVEQERSLENGVTELFSKAEITSDDVLTLLETLTDITDEYHKGAFYAGLLHYSAQLPLIQGQPREILSRFLEAELDRYIAKKDSLTEDEECNIEYIADVAVHFISEKLKDQLIELLSFANKEICLFAVRTLAETDREIPREIIQRLATDISCAAMLYLALKKSDKLHLIPEEYASEEYTAKSAIMRWLEYPAELGKKPDEIEYLGCKKLKKHVFHVFRFRSDSENIDEAKRGKWLIGWSCLTLGAFTPYEEYEKHEKKTVEKTVSHIVKKLIR